VERLSLRGADGAAVEGWLLEPARGGKPWPTVLFIHGGPHLGFGSVFSLDAHLLAGAGFAVLMVNQRGSRGYGDEFANRIIGDLGSLDCQDLMSAVDHVVDRGVADPERLGCCGLSYGGYMACWIGGQTPRFRALAAENPITNFTSFYGTSDIGHPYCLRELGGSPVELSELYRRCSPISFAHRCSTPTLLLQHEEDYRCPASEAEQFYAALESRGCPVEMVRFPGSSHNGAISGPPPVRRAQNRALLEWMTRFLESDKH
jgi:dipeptidyl aminopeptidase/acylaminoacyl peptidase